VDEVHSFDESMFSTLRRFLREFPSVPVLCMTATLPVERRSELIASTLTPYPATTPADLARDAVYERYHVEWIARGQVDDQVAGELRQRRRVLWVSNWVSDCQQVYRRHHAAEDDDDVIVRVFCYHSRFKLNHRKDRHKELIGAFKDSAERKDPCEGLLGATTQVCEMSLDLDAEVLVTDLAPIASLIQRMGRCNRDSKRMRGRSIGRSYVIRPECGKEKPYEKKDLDAAEIFVNELEGKDVSQEKLESVYKACDPLQVEPIKLCPFLDSGPYAEAGQERFATSMSSPCPASSITTSRKSWPRSPRAGRSTVSSFRCLERCAQPQAPACRDCPAGSRSWKAGDTTS
jgi:CRISPR-associated endonuclease/helicase Cas3